ncbi:hypothetical protein P3T76_013904 [Phytophthora citrophthora]|uniref:Uncharacterized protein n=1 Tax=Phytophthora citrophthora TaxID=4793 RepID=A0AAD9G367_9STRA|nr:hypothetical protein P3T76_013904 [Phytophthora citrophthora]
MASEKNNELVVYDDDSTTTVTKRKLGRAIAYVSAQAQDLANNQLQMHFNQQLNFQQQQLYTETHVEEARAEAEARTEALAQMIRSTQVDPAALELHVNSQLQSAISAANTAAQCEARAAAENHAVQQAQISDIRMAEGLKHVQAQLHENLELHFREILSAHIDQVNAQIQLAVATQSREILNGMQQQMASFQDEILSRVLDQAKSTAERKAISIVRLHHAEENAAHDAIKTSLLQNMK